MKPRAGHVLPQQIENVEKRLRQRGRGSFWNSTSYSGRSRCPGTRWHARWKPCPWRPTSRSCNGFGKGSECNSGAKNKRPYAINIQEAGRLVLTRLIMFNRWRQGEASAMTVDVYRTARASNGTPEITSAHFAALDSIRLATSRGLSHAEQ